MNEHVLDANRMYISIDDTLYSVRVIKEDEKLEKGIAYIHDDYVYIYAGKLSKSNLLEPGYCYKDDDGVLKFVTPERNIEQYSIDNIVSVNKDIVDEVKEDDIKEISPDLLLLNESAIFSPKINPEDDIFKRVIKEVLAHKKINIKLHKDKFKNEYDATNMKAAINKTSNMSIKYLVKWCEILEIDLSVNARFVDSEGRVQEINVPLR